MEEKKTILTYAGLTKLEDKLDIDSITVMVQKEVADRLIEIPGGKNRKT